MNDALFSISTGDVVVKPQVPLTDALLANAAAAAAAASAAAAEAVLDAFPEGKSAFDVAVEDGFAGTEAEWLASLVGPPGDIGRAANRAALAAASGMAAGHARMLTEAGREGLFQFDSADRSAEVTADPAQAIYVAPAADATGASGAWVRKYSGRKNLTWFGAVDDGATTNDMVAIQRWLNSGGGLWVPPTPAGARYFYSSGLLELNNHVDIEGGGFSFDARIASYEEMAGSRIKFGAAGGIKAWTQARIDSTTTVNSDPATYFVQEGALNSGIRKLALIGDGGAASTTAPAGIETRTKLDVRGCFIAKFRGCGIDLNGSQDVADAGSDYGSPGGSVDDGNTIIENGLDGIRVRGRDANVCAITNNAIRDNGRWGIADLSSYCSDIHNNQMATNNANHANAGSGGALRASADPLVGSIKILSVNTSTTPQVNYVEGGQGQDCDIPYAHLIEGGGLTGVRNINSNPAPTSAGVTLSGKGRYWHGAAAGGQYIKAGIGSTLVDDMPVAFGVGSEANGNDSITQNGNDLQLTFHPSEKDWQWGNPVGALIRYPTAVSIYARQFAPGFDRGIHIGGALGGVNDTFIGAVDAFGNVPDGSYKIGDIILNPYSIALGYVAKVCTASGVKASTAWAAGQAPGTFTTSLAPYVASYRTNGGNVYRLTAVGGGSTANAPVHGAGSVTGADGYTWLFVNSTAVPTFVSGLPVGTGLTSGDGFLKRSDGNPIIYSPVGGSTTIYSIGGGGFNFVKLDNSGYAAAIDNNGNYYANGTKVVGAQGAAVADATDAASAITQLNALLSRLRTHGLIAT